MISVLFAASSDSPSIAREWRPRLTRYLPSVLIGLLYVGAYLKATKFHGILVAKPVYWAAWADQGQYLRSANALAGLRLDAADYWYPLLYPLLAAPFTALTTKQPFAFVDLGCVVATFVGLTRVARRFGIGPWIATAIFALTTILYPEIGRRWLEPWTTSLSAALVWLAFAQTLEVLDDEGTYSRSAQVAWLGALLALIPMARPGDAIISAILGACAVTRLVTARNWRSVAMLFGVSLAMALPYFALYLAIYGPHPSHYMLLSAAYGLNLGWLGWKAYLLLVEPMPWFPDGEGLLQACPWLILGAAGLVMAVMRRSRYRMAALSLGLAVLAYSACILAYDDLLPSGLWRFQNNHYFKWLLPFFGLFAAIFVRDVRRSPAIATATLAALFALSCIRIVPAPAADGVPARMILFHGPAADFRRIYFSRSIIDDRGGRLRNLFDYHQIPHGGTTISAIALKRDFSGDERWTGMAASALPWPVAVAGQYSDAAMAGPWPRQPIERMRTILSFGAPCWLPPYPCGRGQR